MLASVYYCIFITILKQLRSRHRLNIQCQLCCEYYSCCTLRNFFVNKCTIKYNKKWKLSKTKTFLLNTDIIFTQGAAYKTSKMSLPFSPIHSHWSRTLTTSYLHVSYSVATTLTFSRTNILIWACFSKRKLIWTVPKNVDHLKLQLKKQQVNRSTAQNNYSLICELEHRLRQKRVAFAQMVDNYEQTGLLILQ